jgi:hypothetical protein
MGLGGQHHAPATLLPGKTSITHFPGSWVGPRAGLDGCGKSRPHRVPFPDPPAHRHPGTHNMQQEFQLYVLRMLTSVRNWAV